MRKTIFRGGDYKTQTLLTFLPDLVGSYSEFLTRDINGSAVVIPNMSNLTRAFERLKISLMRKLTNGALLTPAPATNHNKTQQNMNRVHNLIRIYGTLPFLNF